jgi:tetratricopeptide (TPR) repeat protein
MDNPLERGAEPNPQADTGIVDPRYRVLEVLGRGGMGVVYKVLDQIEGRVIALKTLYPPEKQPLKEVDLERFEREIRALSLLAHPGIVRLHDVGRCGGRTFFTMEVLRGLSLQEFLGRPLPGRDEIAWILKIARKVLEALDHLHRAGLVHRDLKPSNIMVLARHRGAPNSQGASEAADPPVVPEDLLADPDPSVKILDFGLAKPLEGPVAPGRAAPGTPLYMAPEQMDPSRPPDPRSDLYSLGVVLYALIARRLPHETVAAALSGRAPETPAARNPACPAALSEFILRLLDPAPFRRYPTALETARALDRAMESGSGRDEPADRLLPPSFVGRVEPIAVLRGILADLASSGKGRVVAVSGMRGAGKTSLLDRSGLKAAAVLEHGIPYLEGRYSSRGVLHQGLREVATGMVLELARNPGQARAGLGPWGGCLLDVLGIDLPEVRSLWSETDAGAAPNLVQERAVHAGVALFRAVARRPLVVILDDIHEADDLDIEILSRTARVIGGLPLVLIAAYDPSAVEGSHGLRAWFEEAAAEGETAVLGIHLGPLSDGEVGQMAASMLPPRAEIDPSLVGSILDETGGVPGAIETSLGSRWRAGEIRFVDGLWRGVPGLREGSKDRGAGRIDPLGRIDPGEKELLLAASVLGSRFEPDMLGAFLSGGDIQTRLHRLVAAGLLLEDATGFSFRPGILPALGSLLPGEARRSLHLRAARALLASGGEASADRWEAAAEHFEAGGDPAAALDLRMRAARRAARLYANRRAIASFRSALALAPAAERGPIRAELGRVHARIGEYGPAIECLGEALIAGESADLLDEVGWIHQCRGDLDSARKCFERCREIAGDDLEARARARRRLGGVDFDRGDLEGAASHFRESLEICRGRGDLYGMAAAHSGLGLVEKRRNDLEAAASHFRESISCAEAAGKDHRAATALNNLGNIHRDRGEDREAIDCFRRSIAIRERIGDRPGLAICLNNLARLLGRRGDLAGAGEAAARALRIFEEVGDRKGVLIATGNCGAFRLFLGDFPGARDAFLRTRALAERLGDRRALADACHALGKIENARGEHLEAQAWIETALRLLSEADDGALRASIFAELATARLALGLAAGAGEAIDAGLRAIGGSGPAESRGALLGVAANLDLASGDAKAAEGRAREALAALEPKGARHDIALAHRGLGQVYREMGPDHVDRAEKHLGTALGMFEEMGARFDWAQVMADVGALWEMLGELGEAAACYGKARDALALVDAPRRLAAIDSRIAAIEGVDR